MEIQPFKLIYKNFASIWVRLQSTDNYPNFFSYQKKSLLLLLCFLLLRSDLPAQSVGIPISETKLIEAIAEYAAQPYPDHLELISGRLNFYSKHIPPALEKDWMYLPVLRRLETMYISAEAHLKGSGEKLLQFITCDLAKNYESIKEDKILKKLLSNAGAVSPPEDYGIIQNLNKLKVPLKFREIIFRMSPYIESGALGGIQNVILMHINLSEEATYNILRESRNVSDALKRAISLSSIPPSKLEQLHGIAQSLSEQYESTIATVEAPRTPNKRKTTNRIPQISTVAKENIKQIDQQYFHNSDIIIKNDGSTYVPKKQPILRTKLMTPKDLATLTPNSNLIINLPKKFKYPYTAANIGKSLIKNLNKTSNAAVKIFGTLVSVGVSIWVVEDIYEVEISDNEPFNPQLDEFQFNIDSLSLKWNKIMIRQHKVDYKYIVCFESKKSHDDALKALFEARELGYANTRIGVFNCATYFSVIEDGYETLEVAQQRVNFLKKNSKYTDSYPIKYEPQVTPCFEDK